MNDSSIVKSRESEFVTTEYTIPRFHWLFFWFRLHLHDGPRHNVVYYKYFPSGLKGEAHDGSVKVNDHDDYPRNRLSCAHRR